MNKSFGLMLLLSSNIILAVLISSCTGPSADERQRYLEFAKTKLTSQLEEHKKIKEQMLVQRAFFATSTKENAAQITSAIDTYLTTVDGSIEAIEGFLNKYQGPVIVDPSGYEVLKKAIEQQEKNVESGKALIVQLQQKSGVQ